MRLKRVLAITIFLFVIGAVSFPSISAAALILDQSYFSGSQDSVAFDSPAAALVFLEEFPKTAEWQAYNEEVNGSVSLVRSYMELTAISLNED